LCVNAVFVALEDYGLEQVLIIQWFYLCIFYPMQLTCSYYDQYTLPKARRKLKNFTNFLKNFFHSATFWLKLKFFFF